MKETWKICPLSTKYEVSNLGRIRRVVPPCRMGFCNNTYVGKILKSIPGGNNGYLYVNIDERRYAIHYLVLLTFMGPRPTKHHCCHHKDGNKHNNKLTNISWVSYSYNLKSAIKDGLRKPTRGEKVTVGKLKKRQVLEIRQLISQGSMPQELIGKVYGVSGRTISSIKNKETWAWL